jgi:type VI secretion system protein ImpK
VLAAGRGDPAAGLSGRWQGAALPLRRPRGATALWAAACACVLALAGLYFAYAVSLGALSDPVARQIAQLKPAAPAGRAAAIAAAGKPAQPGALARQLAAEIQRGELEVSEIGNASVIVLKSDDLFGSGSARLNAALHPLIARIAGALDDVPGAVVITGHTDDVPIRTARYPSNWELSTERARSVVTLMAARLRDPARLRAEGLADSEPLAPNDSAASRARNRRVAIVLRGGA